MKNKILLILFFVILFSVNNALAKELTIVYTGDSHAMLYPCNCPYDPEGGVARRATAVKQIKSQSKEILLLDSGNFFSGGLMDDYSQDQNLNKERTIINLKALDLIGYDALGVQEDELNFGFDFLKEMSSKNKVSFLSSNLNNAKILPYIVKEVSGVKIGVTAITNPIAKKKSADLQFISTEEALSKTVGELKKKNAQLIIVLSRLTDPEIAVLSGKVTGIDIFIQGISSNDNPQVKKIGSALVLASSWQSRGLDKLTLDFENKLIKNFKHQNIPLDQKITDDKAILKILPVCFSDSNCKKEGFIGSCQNPGSDKAKCDFVKAQRIGLVIVTTKNCTVCTSDKMITFLKERFPGLEISYKYYPSKEVSGLIKEYKITALPAYLLEKQVNKEKNFAGFKEVIVEGKNYYMLKPEFSGIAYLLDRKEEKGKLVLFLSLYDKSTVEVLNVVKEFNPEIHFLAISKNGEFDAFKGKPEVEDYLRGVCIKKYYPQYFWDYIFCRAKDFESSWWNSCLSEKIDPKKISVCAQGKEAKELLKQNISLGEELKIMFGPTYLINNIEIFGTQGVPKKDGLKKILNKR